MNETLFYVLGLGLVAIALIVSFVGLKFDKFPNSRGVLIGGTIAIAVVVVGTMVYAWRNAEDEQHHREAELAEAAEESAAEGDDLEVAEQVGEEAADLTTTTEDTASIEEGAQIFATTGCAGCHTLAEADSTGTTGPDLDGALKGQSEDYIRTAIVDPNADIATNYPPDVMPQNYSTELSEEQLNALVAYLAQATSGN
jgi:mono/diheme cytochrome c family protein